MIRTHQRLRLAAPAGRPIPGMHHALEMSAPRPEPRWPGFLAFLACAYLLSVPLLSSAMRLQASWIPQAIGAAVVVCWLLYAIVTRRRVVLPCPVLFYVLWYVWALTGIPYTASGPQFLTNMTTLLKVVVMTWVCAQCVRTRADLLLCLLITGLANIVVFYEGADVIIRSATYSGTSEAARVAKGATLIANSNSLALSALVLLVGSLTCALAYRSPVLKLLAVLPIPCALYNIAASGSRKAMVGILLVGAGLFWFHFRRAGKFGSGKKLLMVLGGLAVAIAAAFFVVKSPFVFRLIDVFSSMDNLMREPRVEYFFSGLEATAEHPIFGLGIGGFARAGLSGPGTQHYSHSTVTETAVSTGIPGFILYFSAQIALYTLLQRLRRTELPPSDRVVVNISMALFWLLQWFSVAAVMYDDRLIWPLTGALCGYLVHLKARYLAARAPAERPQAPTVARLRRGWIRPRLPR